MSLAVVFGTNLRNFRKAKRLTQAELAEKVSLSTEMISKIERGVAAPSFASIEKLSEILEVGEVAFFGVGLVKIGDSDRLQLIAKIQAKISRLSDERLTRVDKLLNIFIE